MMIDTLEELLWENRRLFRALAEAADEALETLGIQSSERALLEFLARETAPVSLSELARRRNVSRQHIHQSLARLRDPGWIEKSPDPDDSRSVRIRLTAKGKRFWKEIRAIDRVILRRITRHVDGDQVMKAAKTLRRIREALEARV